MFFKGAIATFLSVSVLLAGCGQEEASTNRAGNVPKVKDEFIQASDKAKSPVKSKRKKRYFCSWNAESWRDIPSALYGEWMGW